MTPPRTIAASVVGVAVDPIAQPVDARWLMAYAAGLAETHPGYFDTQSAAGPAAHPLFAVCYEWPVALAIRAAAIPDALAPLSVHASHDLTIHRPPRAGDTLTTTARIVAAEPRRAGTLVTTRLVTVDAAGRPVTTTDYGSVYRGVTLSADPATQPATSPTTEPRALARDADPGASPAGAAARWTEPVDVGAGAAHVYTECARIWNPIHTDIAVARAAGLPGLILHGTATLALAISRVVARDLDADPTRVRRITARFTGMVPMPGRLVVRGLPAPAGRLAFDVRDAHDRPVLSQGVITA